MEDKILKHLEFIQNTINRMSTNSFIIKGWAITLIGIILSFTDIKGKYMIKSQYYNFPIEMLLVLFAILLFWCFNAYFLQQERRYIYIYSKAIEQFNQSNSLILDMDYRKYCLPKSKSKSVLIWLFLIVCLITITAALIFFSEFHLKLIFSVSFFLILLFTVSYLLPDKVKCDYWACFLGRTVISVYGTMIVLLLLVNHSMFNSVHAVQTNKQICRCAVEA